ncbi:MAG TPA: RNA polymerase sigma factor, partial [Bacteroidota bacterium]
MEPVSSAEKHTAERTLVNDFLAARDARSFHKLYGYVTPYLYQLVYRLVGRNDNNAQDILQDVWIRAVERLPEFRWESSVRTWIAGIAVNRCRELFKQRAKAPLAILDDDGAIAGGASTPHALRLDLDDAIARLPDGFRTVLVLHDVEGFTHEEVGALLGIETGTS